MKDIIDYEKTKELSDRSMDIPLYLKILKFNEEIGEVNQEYLAFCNSPNASKSASGTIEALTEELCDTLNQTFDILNHLENENLVTSEEVKAMFSKKLEKWESKMENK